MSSFIGLKNANSSAPGACEPSSISNHRRRSQRCLGARSHDLGLVVPILGVLIGLMPVTTSAAGPWIEVAAVDSPTGVTQERFGASLAAGAGYVLVGAPSNGASNIVGNAYVVDLTDPAAPRVYPKINRSNRRGNDRFGCAVDIEGRLAAIGSEGWNDGGAVYLFDMADPASPREITWLQPPIPTPNGLFGCAVGLEDQLLVIGAEGEYSVASEAGAVYVYSVQSPLHPRVLARILPESTNREQDFGAAIAVEGAVLAIGAPSLGKGEVFIYDLTAPTNPLLISRLSPPQRASSAGFGSSLAMRNGLLVGGAPWDIASGERAGSAYFFDLTQPQAPVQLSQIIAIDASYDDRFGEAVALSDDRILIGAPLADRFPWSDTGAMYVYTYDSALTPELEIRLIPFDTFEYDGSGAAVAIADDLLICGADVANRPNVDAGAIYVYASGFELTIEGACPGNITARVNVGRSAEFAYFVAGTRHVPGGGPAYPDCFGLTLDLEDAWIVGSARPMNGEAILSGRVPPNACGRVYLQAVHESPGCRKSDVVLVE